MWAWFTAGGVSLVLLGGLAWWALRAQRLKGEQNERDRQIKASSEIVAKQRDVAAGPPVHRGDLIERMRRGEL